MSEVPRNEPVNTNDELARLLSKVPQEYPDGPLSGEPIPENLERDRQIDETLNSGPIGADFDAALEEAMEAAQ